MQRKLFLVWKADTFNGENIPIGALNFDGRLYTFYYLDGLRKAESLGFHRPLEFPDAEEAYEGQELFPIFSNRLMPEKKKFFKDYLNTLGLKEQDSSWISLRILDRSRGVLATDNFRLFLKPEPENGFFKVRTFTSGATRDRFKENLRMLSRMRPHPVELILKPEPNNPYDKNAILVCSEDGLELGFVPAYYSSELSPLLQKGMTINCILEKMNQPVENFGPEVLLITLKMRWPKSWEPFENGQYLPYTKDPSLLPA